MKKKDWPNLSPDAKSSTKLAQVLIANLIVFAACAVFAWAIWIVSGLNLLFILPISLRQWFGLVFILAIAALIFRVVLPDPRK